MAAADEELPPLPPEAGGQVPVAAPKPSGPKRPIGWSMFPTGAGMRQAAAPPAKPKAPAGAPPNPNPNANPPTSPTAGVASPPPRPPGRANGAVPPSGPKPPATAPPNPASTPAAGGSKAVPPPRRLPVGVPVNSPPPAAGAMIGRSGPAESIDAPEFHAKINAAPADSINSTADGPVKLPHKREKTINTSYGGSGPMVVAAAAAGGMRKPPQPPNGEPTSPGGGRAPPPKPTAKPPPLKPSPAAAAPVDANGEELPPLPTEDPMAQPPPVARPPSSGPRPPPGGRPPVAQPPRPNSPPASPPHSPRDEQVSQPPPIALPGMGGGGPRPPPSMAKPPSSNTAPATTTSAPVATAAPPSGGRALPAPRKAPAQPDRPANEPVYEVDPSFNSAPAPNASTGAPGIVVQPTAVTPQQPNIFVRPAQAKPPSAAAQAQAAASVYDGKGKPASYFTTDVVSAAPNSLDSKGITHIKKPRSGSGKKKKKPAKKVVPTFEPVPEVPKATPAQAATAALAAKKPTPPSGAAPASAAVSPSAAAAKKPVAPVSAVPETKHRASVAGGAGGAGGSAGSMSFTQEMEYLARKKADRDDEERLLFLKLSGEEKSLMSELDRMRSEVKRLVKLSDAYASELRRIKYMNEHIDRPLPAVGEVLESFQFGSGEALSKSILSERVYYSGWVFKEGNIVANWKRRFFVLQASRIRYYEKPSDASPKGEIELSACMVSPYQVRPGLKNISCIEVLLQKRKWHFYAQLEIENRGWYSAITNRIIQLSYLKRCEMAKQITDKRILEFLDNTNLSLYRGAPGAGDLKQQAIHAAAQLGSSEFEKSRAEMERESGISAASFVGGAGGTAANVNSYVTPPLAAAIPLLLNDKTLTLDTCSVAARILSDPVCQPVSALEVKNAAIGSTEVDVLCSAIASNPVTTVRSFNLSDNQLVGPRASDTNGWRALGHMLAAPTTKIEELILNNCKLDDGAMEVLAKAISETRTGRIMAPLRRVCLDRNEISSRGLTVLVDLFVASSVRYTLVHFSLSKNNLTDDGFVYFINKLLPPPPAVSTAAGGGASPQVSDSLVTPPVAVSASSLLHIDFHDNLLTDSGAIALARLVVSLSGVDPTALASAGGGPAAAANANAAAGTGGVDRCSLLSIDLSGNAKMTAGSGAALSHMAQLNNSLESLAFMQHRVDHQGLTVMRLLHRYGFAQK